jgi:hypothetical protein
MTATAQRTNRSGRAPEKRKLTRQQIAARTAVIAVVVGILAMWIYAFGFAGKTAVAGLQDTAWVKRAEAICVTRNDRMATVVKDFAKTDGGLPALHDSIKATTDLVEGALDEIVSVRPHSAQDQRLVDEWEHLYRIYIGDRRAAEVQMANGKRAELSETMVNGSPISMTIADFTNPNRMQSCAPPVGQ